MDLEISSKISSREIIKSMNYNVKLIFGYSALNSLGQGVWMYSALSMYIYLLAGTIEGGLWGLSQAVILGLTSAASGITMTIFVFPAGFFADRFRRDIILKLAGVIGLASLAFIAFGNNFVYIFISLFLFGMFNALTRPSIEALFADSVTSGYRSKIYSWVHLVNQVAGAIGPFLSAILFAIFGNNWDIPILKKVMYIGFSISVLSIILLYFFTDKKSLGKESESIPEEVAQSTEEENTSRLALKVDSVKSQKLIPILLISANLIIGVGAGMTIKYFPVFFSEQYLISPIWLQIIMGGTSLATGIFALLGQKISLKLGRVQTIFLVQFIATTCLALITIYPPLWILVPLFIFRGSFMNAGQPLSQSILMDIIPKKNRGVWNSIQSIAWGLFWNLSAVIGGFLIGINNNFNLCFIITTFIYILGMIPLVIMMPLVGKEREAKQKELEEKFVPDDKLLILDDIIENKKAPESSYNFTAESLEIEKLVEQELE
ncbi:MAG TPA: MFS transporter [Candidatus Bathyarchaeia archaeon]|nr:MFS transporter [Candidatus Bathyarchaeia archaeon]